MADVKLSVIADLLIKAGKFDSTELDKALAGYLKKQALPDVIVDPNVKFPPSSVSKFRTQLKQHSAALQAVIEGNAKDLTGEAAKAYSKIGITQAASLQKFYRDLNNLLSTRGIDQRVNTKAFRKKMDEIAQGVRSVFDLKPGDREKAKLYAQHLDNVGAQLSQLETRARSLGKSFTKGSVLAADPLLVPGAGKTAADLKAYSAQLRGALDERKQIEAAQTEAIRYNKQRDAELLRTAKQSERTKDKVNRDAIKKEQRRAADRLAAARKSKAALEQEFKVRLGQQAINEAPRGLRDLSAFSKAQLPFVGDTLRARLEQTNQQLSQLAANPAYDSQSKRVKRLQRQQAYLNATIDETNRLLKATPKVVKEAKPAPPGGFVGPQDDPAYRALLARNEVAARILKDEGGYAGIRGVHRDDLPLVNEYLKTQLKNLQESRDLINKHAGPQQAADYKKTSARIREVGDALYKGEQRLRGFGTAAQQTGALFRQFFRYAIGYGALYQALAAIRALVGGVVDLNAALKSIQAVTGATAGAMRIIEASIKRVALVTKFSTKEVAQAAQVLAQAGVEPEQFTSALSSVALFASATETSIETAADLVSTMRNVFKSLDDLTIANQLTKAVNISKLTGEDLKTILSRGAQVAHGYNLTSEQFLAAVTVLRNAGLKASTVATGLRQGLIELLSPDAKTIKALQKRYEALGEGLDKQAIKDKFFGFGQADNPLLSVLQEYKRIGFSGAAKKDFQRVFDVRATNAINALINNLDELQSAESKLTFGNAALAAAQTQMESLQSSVKNLGAAITVLSANMSEGMVSGLENVTDAATDTIQKLTELDSTLKASTGLGVGTIATAGLAGGALATIGGGSIKSKVGRFALGTAAGSIGAYGGLEGAKAQGGDQGTAKTSAFIGAALGITAIDGIIGFFKNAHAWAKDLPLAEAGAKKLGTVFKWLRNFGNKFSLSVLARLGVAGVGNPIIAGLLGLATVIGALFTFFGSDALATAKEKLQQSLKNYEKAKADQQAIIDSSQAYRLGDPVQGGGSTSAAPGTTAADVEQLKTDVTNYNATLSTLFKSDKLKEATAVLLKLSSQGAEEGPLRDKLIEELNQYSKAEVGYKATSKQQILELSQLGAKIASTSSGLQESLRAELIRIRSVEGKLSLVDQSLLDAAAELGQDPTKFAQLNDLIKATPKEISDLFEELLRLTIQHVDASEEAKAAATKVAEDRNRALENAIADIKNAKSTEEVTNKVNDMATNAKDLTSSVKDLLTDLSTGLQHAREAMEKERQSWLGKLKEFFSDKSVTEGLSSDPRERVKQLQQRQAAAQQAAADRLAYLKHGTSDPNLHLNQALTGEKYTPPAKETFPTKYDAELKRAIEDLRLLQGQERAKVQLETNANAIAEANKKLLETVAAERQGFVDTINTAGFQGKLAYFDKTDKAKIASYLSGKPEDALSPSKENKDVLEISSDYARIRKVMDRYTSQLEARASDPNIFEASNVLHTAIVQAERDVTKASKYDKATLATSLDDPNNPRVKLMKLRLDEYEAKIQHYTPLMGEPGNPQDPAEKKAVKEVSDARQAYSDELTKAYEDIAQYNREWDKYQLDFSPKSLSLKAQEAQLAKQVQYTAKHNPELLGTRTPENPLVQQHAVQSQLARDEITLQQKRLNVGTQTEQGAAKEALQAARIKLAQIDTAFEENLKKYAADAHQKSLALRAKLDKISLDAVNASIDQAYKSGSFSAIPKLQEQRLSLLKEQYAIELDKLRLSTEDKGLIEATKAENEKLLKAATLQAYSAETYFPGIKQGVDANAARVTTGSLSKDAAREVSGVPYSNAQKAKALDANIAFQERSLQQVKAAEPGNLAKIADAYGKQSPEYLNQAAQYKKSIEDLVLELDKLKFQRDELSSNFGRELDQGFNVESTIAGLENLDSSVSNLGETINGEVVQGFDNASEAIANVAVEGGNAFDALRQTAADAMRGIAKSIIQSGINQLFTTGLTYGATLLKGGGTVAANTAKATGGVIKAATGFVTKSGIIKGPGTGTSDSISGVVVDSRGKVVKGLKVSTDESILTAKATSGITERGVNFINKNPVKAAAALQAAMRNPMKRAVGGMMRSQPSAAVAGGAPTTEFTYNSSVKVDASNGGNGQDPNVLAKIGKGLEAKIKETIQREKRPGGILSNP